jgi:acetyl-CoA carboxylase biotin carboxyl carrier protein
MTDAFDRPTDAGADAAAAASAASSAAGAADEVFTPADLVSAGDALAPDLAPDSAGGVAPGPASDRDIDGGTGAAAVADEPEPPASEAAATAMPTPEVEPGDASLLGLIDRLGAILERSDLTEIEVEAGRTTVVLRKPAALAPAIASVATPPAADAQPAAGTAPAVADRGTGSSSGQAAGPPARPSVKAPLTGIWYASPTPGSEPFVEVGRELAVGQVVGLIEAMKLFNEIKSDIAGRVVRVVPDSGTLVKAKQPLIEVDLQ